MTSAKIATISLLAALFAMPAQALTLDQARSSGQVCEQANGMIAAQGGGADVQKLVAEVNAKRAQEYSRISASNKQPLDVVQKLAAQQILKQPGVKLCR